MIERMKQLVNTLNKYRNAYYNDSDELVSNLTYDTMYDELCELEKSTGIILSNSPTQTVGFEVRSNLEKVHHERRLLSLDKTKDVSEFHKFCSVSNTILMHKLDGLTIDLTYENGVLVQAATRGDGEIGEDVTHTAVAFVNIPTKVSKLERFKVSGEAIIRYNNFETINSNLPNDKKYKNPRNLASGSVRQLDSSVTADRFVEFICWNANDLSEDGTMISGLNVAKSFGFTVVVATDVSNISEECLCGFITAMRLDADTQQIPIDGLVAMYNDIEFGKSLGETSHHPKNGFAFKFYDEEEISTIVDVEWTLGKTGTLTPTAVFEPVEIGGTTVRRASLHNVSILKNLNISIGDKVTVIKSNDIIPQITSNTTKHNDSTLYTTVITKCCPVCGCGVVIETSDSGVENLVCINNNCKGKLLGKLTHFVSKHCMNIDGLSESTLEKMIELGIVNNFVDIYKILDNPSILYGIDGFGDRSVNNLIESIKKSKYNVTLSKFINSLSISGIGKSASKDLAKFCEDDVNKFSTINAYELSKISGFGTVMVDSVREWFSTQENVEMLNELIEIISFSSSNNSNNALNGKVFVITGKLTKFKNRDELVFKIESLGGIVCSSVGSNTSFLINNDVSSTSSKNTKAKKLGIPIITEDYFIENFVNDVALNNYTKLTQPKKNSLF